MIEDPINPFAAVQSTEPKPEALVELTDKVDKPYVPALKFPELVEPEPITPVEVEVPEEPYIPLPFNLDEKLASIRRVLQSKIPYNQIDKTMAEIKRLFQ